MFNRLIALPSTFFTRTVTGSGVSDIEMSDDSGLSTGAAVAITFVVTFIVSVAVTVIITFIVTYYLFVKRTLEKPCIKHHLPQEKPTSLITKCDLKLQPNPPYDHDASHVYEVVMDTNTSTAAYETMQVNESTYT